MISNPHHISEVSILGCGWLGLPLALRLKEAGYLVRGSVRDQSAATNLNNNGIESDIINLNETGFIADSSLFWECDLLIISLPPGRKSGNVENFIETMKYVIERINSHHIKQVLFLSSSSVYNAEGDEVNEASLAEGSTTSGKILRNVEELLLKQDADILIARLAGLIGPNRLPGSFKFKQAVISHHPVNLVHQSDVVEALLKLIKLPYKKEIFNICAPLHPTKKAFYELASYLQDGPIPQFEHNMTDNRYKIVSTKKLIDVTGFNYKYPNPLVALDELYKSIKKN